MSFLVDERIEEYAEAHTTPHDALLAELAEETVATMSDPQMLAGPVQGRFFELLVHASGAKRILEVGTFTGYSTLSMAAALPEDGRIDTLEIAPRNAEVAQRYFHRQSARFQRSLFTLVADRDDREARGRVRLRFHDADKPSQDAYYEAVLPRLSARGLIAIDNTLWSGDVLDPQDERTNGSSR